MHDVDLLDRFRRALAGSGWIIELTQARTIVPAPLAHVDEALRRFVATTGSCESADGAIWFMGADDYERDDGEGWNFLQKQISEPSADGAPKWLDEITRFWGEHVPFAISARGDYGYLAVNRSGAVVCGYAPELEDARVVAESYSAFIERIVEECRNRSGDFYDAWIRQL